MKRFLVKLTIFFIPVALFAVFVEIELGKVPNLYNTKRKYFEANLKSIEVLILGGSQAFDDVNPRYLTPRAFNLGLVAQSIYFDKGITFKYIDRMPSLKCALLNVSYASFGNNIYDGPNNWRVPFYAQFWGVKFDELKWYDPKLYSKIMLYTPGRTAEYLKCFFKVTLENANKMDENGWYGNDTANNLANLTDTLGRARVIFHDSLFKEKRFREDTANFYELLAELKKRNIKPVIFSSPLSPTYSKFMNPEHVRRDEQVIAEACRRYNCKYFNYVSDARFDERDFFDDSHLNFIGAEKFSKIIDQEILDSAINKNVTN